MRVELSKIDNIRDTFRGEFVRFGTKNGWKGVTVPTILLKNVILESDGRLMTDHLWFNATKGFLSIELQKGDLIRFDARVTRYKKGYRGYNLEKNCRSPISYDYKLSRPTKIEKVCFAQSGKQLTTFDFIDL